MCTAWLSEHHLALWCSSYYYRLWCSQVWCAIRISRAMGLLAFFINASFAPAWSVSGPVCWQLRVRCCWICGWGLARSFLSFLLPWKVLRALLVLLVHTIHCDPLMWLVQFWTNFEFFSAGSVCFDFFVHTPSAFNSAIVCFNLFLELYISFYSVSLGGRRETERLSTEYVLYLFDWVPRAYNQDYKPSGYLPAPIFPPPKLHSSFVLAETALWVWGSSFNNHSKYLLWKLRCLITFTVI